MSHRVILPGIAGGLVASAALWLPLYWVLPGRSGVDWFEPPGFVEPVGYALAALCVLAAGYVASRWAWAEGSGASRAGVGAGLAAASVAYGLIGGSAAAVRSCRVVFEAAVVGPGDEDQLKQVLGDALCAMSWLTTGTLVGLLIAGAVLGGVGGWLWSRQAGAPWGAEPVPAIRSTRSHVALVVLIVTAILSVVVVLGLHALQGSLIEVHTPSLGPSWLVHWGLLGWPLLFEGLALCGATIWLFYSLQPHWKHPQRASRLAARLWAIIGIVVVILWMYGALSAVPELVATPMFSLIVASWVCSVAASLSWLSLQPAPAEDEAEGAYTTTDALSTGLLCAVVLPVVAAGAGQGSLGAGAALGVVPYIDPLSEGGTAAEAIDIAKSAQSIFFSHGVATALLMAVSALLVSFVLFVPAWWRNRKGVVTVATLLLAVVLTGCPLPQSSAVRCPPGPNDVEVVLVTRDVAAGTVLTDWDIAIDVMPGALVPDSTFALEEDVLGRITREPIREGELIREERLADPEVGASMQAIIPRGMRAVRIQVNDPLIRDLPADSYVDLFASPTVGGEVVSCSVVQSAYLLVTDDLREARPDEGPFDLWLVVPPTDAVVIASLQDAPMKAVARNSIDISRVEISTCAEVLR